MADAVRELAQQHPELLTRECECGLAWAKSCGCIPGSCPWCDDTGRRLVMLEELLGTIEIEMQIFLRAITILPSDTDDNESTDYVVSVLSGGTPVRGHGPSRWEAAARLLIELTRDGN